MTPSWMVLMFELNVVSLFSKTLVFILILMVSVVTQVLKPLLVLTTQEGEPTLRKCFCIKEKQKYVQAIDAIVAQGISCCKACSFLALTLSTMSTLRMVSQM